MYKVSKAYKNKIKQPLRGRGYIKVFLGLFNTEVQNKARLTNYKAAYFSDHSKIFDKSNDNKKNYATLEEDFTTVDGKMLFLPRENSYYFENTGLISNKLVSEEKFVLSINLNVSHADIKGMTIDFGENYPVDFTIKSDNGRTLNIHDNNSKVFVTEEVFDDISSISIVFNKMKHIQNRVRIKSIMFGIGLTYGNEKIISSTFTSDISSINEYMPQYDFSITIENNDKYFNIDNPKSAINFLETGQGMDVLYGYELEDEGKIEWIKAAHMVCKEWEADDFKAKIIGTDVFRSMDDEFYYGKYNENGTNLYTLALEVLNRAGIKQYYLDPYLKDIVINNPLPRVKLREALQIIANTGRCVLMQDRDGGIKIKSNFMPKLSISTNDETVYSNIQNVLDNTAKTEYASMATNYTTADGQMYFLPQNQTNYSLNTGYVSNEISNENCMFSVNPKITIIQEALASYVGCKLGFGNTIPAEFIIRTYNDNTLVNEYKIQDGIEKNTIVREYFDDFNKMEIEFTKTQYPFNRIVLNYFGVGDINDFRMTRNDMLESPKSIKRELVKEIILKYFVYSKTNELITLTDETIKVSKGQEKIYFTGDPIYEFDIESTPATIIDKSNYYIRLKFNTDGECKVIIKGKKYNKLEKQQKKILHQKGTTLYWNNPLISTEELANTTLDWIGEYFTSAIDYEYSYRGNPELDVNDIIYQDSEFDPNMKVNITRLEFTFDKAFSGEIKTRKIGGYNA